VIFNSVALGLISENDKAWNRGVNVWTTWRSSTLPWWVVGTGSRIREFIEEVRGDYPIDRSRSQLAEGSAASIARPRTRKDVSKVVPVKVRKEIRMTVIHLWPTDPVAALAALLFFKSADRTGRMCLSKTTKYPLMSSRWYLSDVGTSMLQITW